MTKLVKFERNPEYGTSWKNNSGEEFWALQTQTYFKNLKIHKVLFIQKALHLKY